MVGLIEIAFIGWLLIGQSYETNMIEDDTKGAEKPLAACKHKVPSDDFNLNLKIFSDETNKIV